MSLADTPIIEVFGESGLVDCQFHGDSAAASRVGANFPGEKAHTGFMCLECLAGQIVLLSKRIEAAFAEDEAAKRKP